jgi:hypothetical protein
MGANGEHCMKNKEKRAMILEEWGRDEISGGLLREVVEAVDARLFTSQHPHGMKVVDLHHHVVETYEDVTGFDWLDLDEEQQKEILGESMMCLIIYAARDIREHHHVEGVL